MVAGGVVAAHRRPGKEVSRGLRDVAAGTVFAAAAVAALLPDVRTHADQPLQQTGGA